MPTSKTGPAPLAAPLLRWTCDPDQFSFETTAEINLSDAPKGQATARDAIRFGLECSAPGQNIYVRGARGTGRLRHVESLLAELSPRTDNKHDFCYVHQFARPDHPRLITLPPGRAHEFRRAVEEFANYIEDGLLKALEGEPHASERASTQSRIQTKIRELMEPLESRLTAANMSIVSTQQGPVPQTAIFPLFEGKPIPPEQLKALVAEEKAKPEQWEEYESSVAQFQVELKKSGREAAEIFREGTHDIRKINENAARELLAEMSQSLRKRFPQESVGAFLDEIVNHTTEFHLHPTDDDQPFDFKMAYGVNVVLTHDNPTACPVVRECSPSLINLLGTVDPKFGPGGVAVSDYQGIRAGALLNANNGYLILHVDDLLSESGGWRALMRTLRTGRLEIVPPEASWMRQYVITQPEPIPINVRIILIGDVRTYYLLDHSDPDFRDLFKVLADFENEIKRDALGIQQYAASVAQLVADEGLPHFDRTGVAALVEHGARIVAKTDKLTARFGRIADIAREASFLTKTGPVTGTQVVQAIQRTKSRASLPSRSFQEFVERGTILVETKDDVVGQINGLAVMHSGLLTYGFPARITATIGPGRAGLINIEGRAQMSGSIHTKGFHILGGLLRFLLNTNHPLAFSASLAFEQSYGGIDGDSASGAEIVCLLSALTGVPIKQGMAMTGAIDQHGHLEAIGGVNEKIEGFFDACNHFGLTGEQGVVIPLANAGDLMLRKDVTKAAAEGTFRVFATDSIFEAIELMTGLPAGRPDKSGNYPKGSVLALAVERAHDYWKLTMAAPDQLTKIEQSRIEDEQQPFHPTDPKNGGFESDANS